MTILYETNMLLQHNLFMEIICKTCEFHTKIKKQNIYTYEKATLISCNF
jgi:hypothetical protein